MRGPNENEEEQPRLLIIARFANRVWDSQKFGRMRAELYDNGWARKRRRKERKKEGRRVFHRDCIGVALIISPVAGTPCLRSTRVFCRFYRFVGLFNC